MFDEKTITSLKYYVYLLVDPCTKEPFYVGKGLGNRVFNHVTNALNSEVITDKYEVIRAIEHRGEKVKHIIVRHGLKEKIAFEIEAALIGTFKYIPNFYNFIKGNIQGGVILSKKD